MGAAQGNRELIADLLSEPAGLRKTQMVRVARLPSTDEARLFGHEPQVVAVAQPSGLRQSKDAFVDQHLLVTFIALRFCGQGGRILCPSQLSKSPSEGLPNSLAIQQSQRVHFRPSLQRPCFQVFFAPDRFDLRKQAIPQPR